MGCTEDQISEFIISHVNYHQNFVDLIHDRIKSIELKNKIVMYMIDNRFKCMKEFKTDDFSFMFKYFLNFDKIHQLILDFLKNGKKEPFSDEFLGKSVNEQHCQILKLYFDQ
jgi:hypothetical protein